MNRTTFFIILFLAIAFIASPAGAKSKFANKDTAKERKDIQFGTNSGNTDISIESDSKSIRMSVHGKKDDENENKALGPIFVNPEIKPPAEINR